MTNDLDLLRLLREFGDYRYPGEHAQLNERLPTLFNYRYVTLEDLGRSLYAWPIDIDENKITVRLGDLGREYIDTRKPPFVRGVDVPNRRVNTSSPREPGTLRRNQTPEQRLWRVQTVDKLKEVLNWRRGQSEFRDMLLAKYEYTCAVTGEHLEEALEAAHIRMYSKYASFEPDNGLILRADIHTLFDKHLISFEPIEPDDPGSKLKVVIAETVRVKPYCDYHGCGANLPNATRQIPNRKHLGEHLKELKKLQNIKATAVPEITATTE